MHRKTRIAAFLFSLFIVLFARFAESAESSVSPLTNQEVCPATAASMPAGTYHCVPPAVAPTTWLAVAASPPVAPPVPPVVSSNGTWLSMTAAMWREVATQRISFGDPNDCKARVDAVPSTGKVTAPGADINDALASNSVMFLSGGTYKPTKWITVPSGKKLIGVAGQVVTIDASGVGFGAIIQNNAVLANVIIEGAQRDGVNFYNAPTDTGSTGSMVYQVSVRHSGYYIATGDGSSGIGVTRSAANNCIVSSEAFDTWNVLGAPNDHGGNSDGINNSFGAHHNTFIDVVSFKNGDYCYFLVKP